jgi:hypothetical protein
MRQLSITDTGIVIGEPMSHKKSTVGLLYGDTTVAESSLYEDKVPDAGGN